LYITYLLTQGSKDLDKLTDFKLVKKFPAYYGIRRIITSLTRTRPPVRILSQISPVSNYIAADGIYK